MSALQKYKQENQKLQAENAELKDRLSECTAMYQRENELCDALLRLVTAPVAEYAHVLEDFERRFPGTLKAYTTLRR